ncbi:MAG: M23 family metallopeptidase [Ilumatobacteraceae bacterium]
MTATILMVGCGRAERPPGPVGWSSPVGWLLAVGRADAAGDVIGARCLRPPVVAPIIDHFRPGDCPYCAGNRGLEFGTPAGVTVHAAAAGTVTFVGRVARIGYVVVDHGDGTRATYGNLVEPAVRRGATIEAGDTVGTTAGTFHFGLRADDVYLDPEPLLGALAVRPQLVPWDGRNRRPPRPADLRCGQRGGAG